MKGIFEGKTILITGGTGFLGRALTEEILKYKPKTIRLFSRDEVKHHMAEQYFNHHPDLRNLLGDIRDYERLERATRGADIVIHAAALKRLDMLEYNVDEAIKTNILGTMNVVRACLRNDVAKAIFVSTDKACSPVNTYGACKFVSERIFIESNYSRGSCPTKFVCVRYGNVLESTGSVIPFFVDRLKKGLPITLTDDRMTRFIISQKQAVELVFSAIKYGIGAEVFVPKLPSMKITDLIDLLKEKYNSKARIEIIGIRPGEKLHELMINESEVRRTYAFNGLYVITSQIEKYLQAERTDYLLEKNRLSDKEMQEYSSRDSVVPKAEVKKILLGLNIL